jgi:hypothetical protein
VKRTKEVQVQQPAHPEFVKALQDAIEKFAAEFKGETPEMQERAAHRYAATRFTNTLPYRRLTKGRTAVPERTEGRPLPFGVVRPGRRRADRRRRSSGGRYRFGFCFVGFGSGMALTTAVGTARSIS